MRLGLLYISVAQSSFESQISFVTLRVQRSVCINLYNIKKKLSDPPSLLCQIYADPPFLGRQKVNDPPLNSSGPPTVLKNECSLKLLYNLPHQHNFSTSMGQNLYPTFSVPPWLYRAKSNRKRCFLYFSVSSGYKSRRLTRILWCERWHNYRYVTRKSGDWGYRSPNVKLVKQAICHSQSAN